VPVSNVKLQRAIRGVARIVVISAGVSDQIHAAVRIFCDPNSKFEYRGRASSIDTLLRACTEQAPQVILMDSNWEGGYGLQTLVRLHRALPTVRTLLVGDSLDLSTISRHEVSCG
jgi:DNA-binding NarL/FixJ family response regulator